MIFFPILEEVEWSGEGVEVVQIWDECLDILDLLNRILLSNLDIILFELDNDNIYF